MRSKAINIATKSLVSSDTGGLEAGYVSGATEVLARIKHNLVSGINVIPTEENTLSIERVRAQRIGSVDLHGVDHTDVLIVFIDEAGKGERAASCELTQALGHLCGVGGGCCSNKIEACGVVWGMLGPGGSCSVGG